MDVAVGVWLLSRDWVRWIHQSRVQGAGLVVTVGVEGPPVWGMPRKLSRVVSGVVVVVVPCGVAVVEAKNVALLKVWGASVVCVSSVWVSSSVRVRAVKPRVRRLLVGEAEGA